MLPPASDIFSCSRLMLVVGVAGSGQGWGGSRAVRLLAWVAETDIQNLVV